MRKKENFLELVDEAVRPMDVIGTLGGVKFYNPLTWFGRWIQSETSAPIGHVECVGEKDADGGATIYSTDFRFKQISLQKELKGQKRIIIKRMPGLTAGQVEIGLEVMRSFVGKPYPIFDPLMMKAQSILNPAAYKLMLDDPDPVCSQSVGIAFDKMGLPISPGLGKHWSRLTPIDVISDDRMEVVAYWNWDLPEGAFLI